MTIDPKLLEILACPSCKGGLKEVGGSLNCTSCSKSYPVEDGIPVLMVEQARDRA